MLIDLFPFEHFEFPFSFVCSLSSDLNGISAIAESLGAYCCANNPFKMNSVNLLSHRGEL